MKIGKQDLPFADHRKFDRQGLLDLHDHFALLVDLLWRSDDGGSGFFIFLVRKSRSLAGSGFNENLVSVCNHLLDARRRHGHPVFLGLYFFQDTDFHGHLHAVII